MEMFCSVMGTNTGERDFAQLDLLVTKKPAAGK